MLPILRIVLLLLVSMIVSPVFSVVSAHELAADEKIGAVFHVDPNDAPIANQPSTIFFYIRDVSGRFDANNCTCVLSVAIGGKEVYKRPIATGNNPNKTEISAPFTFTTTGSYTVTLAAAPKTPGGFVATTLSYPITVAKAGEAIPQEGAMAGQMEATPPLPFMKKYGSFLIPTAIFGSLILIVPIALVLKKKQ